MIEDSTLYVVNESTKFEDLPEEIQARIIERTGHEDHYNDREIYVTELVYCLAKAYYRRKTTEQPEKGLRQRWALYRGILFDEEWTSLFPRNQVRVTHRIPGGPTIVGKIDFMDEEGGIWELKTVANDYAIRDGPKPQHVAQALFYAWVQNAPTAHLLYLHLGGVHRFDLDVRRAEEIVKELEAKAVKLHIALLENTPPDPENAAWECKYCEFKDICPFYQRGARK